MHLLDSLGSSRDITYTVFLHEQALAIAAESYAQYTNRPSAALVTTGPGGTNSVTGLAAAWLDSTPVFFISGQVKRSDMVGTTGVRQIGPQEIGIIPIVQSITKYAVTVMEPSEIRYHLERAWYEATNGRKGPVWLDIPLDVQAAEIDEESLTAFKPDETVKKNLHAIDGIPEMLNRSRRPLILAGNGIKMAGAGGAFLELIDRLNIPVILTWKVLDLLPYTHRLNFGCPGSLGHRYANFILQNCDLLMVIGSRLDVSITAFNQPGFAPNATKILIDVDKNEMDKMNFDALRIVSDAGEFIESLSNCITEPPAVNEEWLAYCNSMKSKYPVVLPEYREQTDFVNAYVFIEELCAIIDEDEIIVPESSGSAGEVTFQAWKVKEGQKIRNAAALGSMGFGLPYSIGACIANGQKRVILINGDGAFQLNIQELETIQRLKLPVKIFIWSNGGYASIMATQRNFFNGRYVASERGSGLTLPDIKKIGEAYGLKSFKINTPMEVVSGIKAVLESDGAVICEVRMNPLQPTVPRVQSLRMPDGTMKSKPLHDMFPFLSENEIRENMLNTEHCVQ